MDTTQPAAGLAPGARQTEAYVVEEKHSAATVGSGSVPVLATPWLVAYMERTAHSLAAATLPDGFTSVGVRIDIRHLAPTPLGWTVTVTAEVTEVSGRRIRFELQARDEREVIGEGQHERVVVETARFLDKLAQKS